MLGIKTAPTSFCDTPDLRSFPHQEGGLQLYTCPQSQMQASTWKAPASTFLPGLPLSFFRSQFKPHHFQEALPDFPSLPIPSKPRFSSCQHAPGFLIIGVLQPWTVSRGLELVY